MDNSSSDRPKPTKETETAGNALWRIAEWFPKLEPRQLELLQAYHTELMRFNGKLNLISRGTERDADETHFADCLFAIEPLLNVEPGYPVYDIGSGNGLPGVILAIMQPHREVMLLESDQRKCEFLKHIVAHLKLTNVKILNIRLESLLPNTIRFGVARGFASLSKACLMCSKIFETGGRFYHLKSNTWSSEVVEFPAQLIKLWSPELSGEYLLPVSQARRALVCTIRKI